MVRKHKSDWRAVQLPKPLVDTIEELLQTDQIKKQGITSIGQFISRSVSKTIENLIEIDYIAIKIEKGVFQILDKKLKKVAFVDRSGTKLQCKTCNSDDCSHITYLQSLHNIAPILAEMYNE